MKQFPIKTAMFLLGLTIAIPGTDIYADETGNKAGDEAFLTPENMTRDDGQLLKEYSALYNQCLTDTSIKQMQTESDPRRVVDYAMKTCAVKLEELDKKMIERNFDPDFRRGYIHSVSNRSANNVLRTVMVGMAAKQEQADE